MQGEELGRKGKRQQPSVTFNPLLPFEDLDSGGSLAGDSARRETPRRLPRRPVDDFRSSMQLHGGTYERLDAIP